jgi:hypothetical protein
MKKNVDNYDAFPNGEFTSFCIEGEWKYWGEMTIEEKLKKIKAKIMIWGASQGEASDYYLRFWENLELQYLQ